MIFEPPECCQNCRHFNSEYSEWSNETYYYCYKNVWWPTKKQTCKKKSSYPEVNHE